MDLPRPLAILAWKEIRDFAKEKSMPFITGADIVEREEALAEGLAKGREEGRQEGRLEAKEHLVAGIEAVLDVKFAAPGLALLPEIQRIEDPQLLRKILQAVRQADTPEVLRRIWAKP
jgi:flagellar biosynthesis/type III secretory pathway protein FliH